MGTSGSVLATRIAQRAWCAMDVQTFWPVTASQLAPLPPPAPSGRAVGAGTVADRAGGQARQVRARARLAEQLAPDLLAGPQRAQPALLLLRRAEREDGRRGHAQADADPPRVVVRRAGRGELGVGDRLQRARRAEAAQAGGIVHPGQAGVEPGAQEVELAACVAGSCAASSSRTRRRMSPRRRAARRPRSSLVLGQHSGPPAT